MKTVHGVDFYTSKKHKGSALFRMLSDFDENIPFSLNGILLCLERIIFQIDTAMAIYHPSSRYEFYSTVLIA